MLMRRLVTNIRKNLATMPSVGKIQAFRWKLRFFEISNELPDLIMCLALELKLPFPLTEKNKLEVR